MLVQYKPSDSPSNGRLQILQSAGMIAMTVWLGFAVLTAAVSYLFGSIPTGYWLGKLLKGIDIREHGSKSTGATNVLRTLGKGPAVVTLLIDLLKGVAAVVFTRWLYTQALVPATAPATLPIDAWIPWAIAIAALFAIVGHSRSVWIQFRGGKSAATGLGVLLGACWPVGLGVALSFIVVLAIWRIVSLSSMVAALVAIALMVLFHQPLAFITLAIVGAAYVIARHTANVKRLMAGTEPTIGRSTRV